MDGRIHKVVRAISQDVGRSWSVEDMADLAGVSLQHFSKLFKQETKLSPKEYIKFAKMSVVAEQLRDPDCVSSIKEIARLVGCQDESHFTKDFKKHYGMTPTDFRKKEAEKFQTEYESARNLKFGQ